ncbi:MAG TPA: phospholipase D-like domain-containing protein [Gemmatimonadales bacterium]|nr:phospholipase D-like domain-containing protein [Gemmatimonadales bacterium]
MSAPADPRRENPIEIVDRAMDRAAGSRPIPGNRLTLLFDGPAIYPAMLERIAKATRWIHLDSYIFRSDDTGRRFAEALAERARAGVRVRILTDWVGSLTTRPSLWRNLRKAGASVRSFNPPRLLHLHGNFSRDHRKLLVVDGETAITGGHCIGNEWAGNPKAGRQPWRDTAIAIDGPAAAAVDQAFRVPWGAVGTPLDDGELATDVPERGDSLVRVVAGEPGGVRASRATELLLAGAVERVWITDAYLVAPRDIYQSMMDAAQSGVDVRVLVPGKSDLPRVQSFTRIGYRDLIEAGVRIFEWRGPMLHAKTIVVDGRWVRIGSTNLNVSSLLANYEIDVLTDDMPLAHAMETQYRRDLDQSVEVKYRDEEGRRRRRALAAFPLGPPPEQRRHRPSFRERRNRATVAVVALVSGARRSIFLQYSLILTVLGVFFLLFPRAMAAVFGFLSLWLAIATGLETWGRPGRN